MNVKIGYSRTGQVAVMLYMSGIGYIQESYDITSWSAYACADKREFK